MNKRIFGMVPGGRMALDKAANRRHNNLMNQRRQRPRERKGANDRLVLPPRKVAKWISVMDRLPEEWKTVLTFQPTPTDDKGIIQTCVYIGIPGKWRQAWNHDFLELPVTHWMPLPEPPQKESDVDG